MTTVKPQQRLKDLLDELDVLTKTIARDSRAALYPERTDWHNPTPWANQEEKSAAWPRPWFPMESMCDAIRQGIGSGEGSLTRPGWQACTRPAGHRDLRSGDNRYHAWGPERYSEGRARSAAHRECTENWLLFKQVNS